jgi:hypothetical protein
MVSPASPPVSRKQLLNTFCRLFLTTVRADTERGDLKDRPWKVKETLLLPRECPLHLKGISTIRQCKKAIKPTPHPDPQIPVSRSPYIPPTCSLSFLFSTNKFSTNKILPTSAVRVFLYFHSQSRLKNPEHLKFLCVSFLHQVYHWGIPQILCPVREFRQDTKVVKMTVKFSGKGVHCHKLRHL